MANFHSVSFAVAGSREAVNQAILLMAKNIAAANNWKVAVKELDDPDASFAEYRHDLDESYYAAFAGAGTQDRYLGETASSVVFDGNDRTCVLCLRYSTAWRLNSDDLGTFVEALAKTCAFEACAIHGDEEDWYDQLRVSYYSADGAGEVQVDEDSEWLTAGNLAIELRRIHRRGKIRELTDAGGMAWAAAADMWRDWGGESVFDALWEAGAFGEGADEDEARGLFEEYPYDVVLCYASHCNPVTREKVEEGW